MNKKWIYILAALVLVGAGVFAFLNYQSTSVVEEPDIEGAESISPEEEEGLQLFARGMIDEMQQMYYEKHELHLLRYEERLKEMIQNEESAENYFGMVDRYLGQNTVEVNEIRFSEESERIVEQDGRYFYQITAEGYVSNETSGTHREDVSYFLQIDQSGEEYTLLDVRVENGHLANGGGSVLSVTGRTLMVQESIGTLVEQGMGSNQSDEEVIGVFRRDEDANRWLEDYSGTISGEVERIVVPPESMDYTLTTNNEYEDATNIGVTGEVQITTRGGEEESLTYEADFIQENPFQDRLKYVVDSVSFE